MAIAGINLGSQNFPTTLTRQPATAQLVLAGLLPAAAAVTAAGAAGAATGGGSSTIERVAVRGWSVDVV